MVALLLAVIGSSSKGIGCSTDRIVHDGTLDDTHGKGTEETLDWKLGGAGSWHHLTMRPGFSIDVECEAGYHGSS